MPSDLAIQAAEIQRQRRQVEELLAEHTGRPLERIEADVERDTVFDGAVAKEYGIVDQLAGNRKALPPHLVR